jgi:magnesium transporter
MVLDLKFSIGTLGLAAGTLCSALYGMNLKNFLEESDIGFAAVSGTCFVFTVFVCAFGLLKLRKVQRVRMWGEGGIQERYTTGLRGQGGATPTLSRGNWRSDSVHPIWAGLPAEGRQTRLRRMRNGATPSAAGSMPNRPKPKQDAAPAEESADDKSDLENGTEEKPPVREEDAAILNTTR